MYGLYGLCTGYVRVLYGLYMVEVHQLFDVVPLP